MFFASAAGVMIVNVVKRLTPGDGRPMTPHEIVTDILFITIGLAAGEGVRRSRNRSQS